jgi:hypothetical protein
MHHLTLNLFLADVPNKVNALMHVPSVMLDKITSQQLEFFSGRGRRYLIILKKMTHFS